MTAASPDRPTPLCLIQQALSPYLYSEWDDGAECTRAAEDVLAALAGCGHLPADPTHLLTDQQHKALQDDLDRLAHQRRRVEASSRAIPIGSPSEENPDA